MKARKSLSRPVLLGLFYAIGLVNALAPDVIVAWGQKSALGTALSATFNISMVMLVACGVGLRCVMAVLPRPVDRLDVLAFAVFAGLVLVPHRAASWVAISGLALFELARDRRCAVSVSAASMFLAIAIAGFWARVVVQAFAPVLLAADAWMVATLLPLLGAEPITRVGNVIEVGDQMSLVVILGCDSLTNVSYALLWWLAVVRVLTPAWKRSDLAFAAAVVAGVVLINSLRVAGMGLSPEAYQWIHNGRGTHVYNVGLLVGVALAAVGATVWSDASSRRRAPAARRIQSGRKARLLRF